MTQFEKHSPRPRSRREKRLRSKPIIILAVIGIALLVIFAFSGIGGNFGR
ncbi:hypothetical protein GGQ71_002885 [Rhizobium taibaishanense]|uniref:Uncharacterized protein n=1 Tax=Allorhizobium taibaishanense TaxID=887144 RepID=A0A7W6HNQ7_9HYPH|nr:hypothetical protein [Allorhizobium taibaishanense]